MRPITLLALLSILPVCSAHTQEWSPRQQEVWSNVQVYWDHFAKEDLEGFLSYLHDDFRGWSYGTALPRDKAYVEKTMPQAFATSETILYDIRPVAIQVHDGTAIVHYYYERTYMDDSGTQRSDSGRWTDVLVPQGDRWVMIADHGGSGGG
jgi:hypothetical protein